MQEQRLGHETGLSLPSCVSYNDGTTPSVTYSYDRRGRAVQIVRNSITTALTYSEGGQLLREGYTGGTLDGLSITNIYDSLLRRTNVSVKNGTSVLAGTGYGYDNASRLSAVTDGTNTATYTYVANSPLVGQIAFTQNGSNRMTTTKTYDALTRLSSIVNQPSADSAVSFAYQFNNANQRTRVTHADGSYWRYEYDALGQVTSGRKFWSDGTPVAGQQFDYTFDDIGNRKQTKAGGDQNGSGKRVASYSVNDLNQYTQRDVPGGFDVLGVARGTVTVNGNSTYRKGEYFRNEVSVSNGSTPQYQSVNVTATDGSSVSETGNVFIAKTPEVFGYDLDGNLTNDGRWALTWDAENRLIKQESLADAPLNSSNRLTFAYDPQSRRIQKVSEIFTNGAWIATLDHRFIYDDWNLLAAVNNTNGLEKSWCWGLDLSGNLKWAGGVGGLLFMTIHTGANAGVNFHCHDGNGNVVLLLSASTGNSTARYEYDPFHRLLRTTGSLAALNPFLAATKFFDGETGLYYYGYRYYSPQDGRWLNRDPLEENGGVNLYGAILNNGPNYVDPLGLKTCAGFGFSSYKLGARVPVGPLTGEISIQGQFAYKRCETCCGKEDNVLDIGVNAIGQLTGSTAGFEAGAVRWRAGIIAKVSAQGNASGHFESDRCHGKGLTGSVCVSGKGVGSIGGGAVATISSHGVIFSVGADIMGNGSISWTKCYKCDNDVCSWGKTKVCLAADVTATVYVGIFNYTATFWSGSTCFDLD